MLVSVAALLAAASTRQAFALTPSTEDAPGVTGVGSYTSSSFGYSVAWEPSWEVQVAETSGPVDDGKAFDSLTLQQAEPGRSALTINGLGAALYTESPMDRLPVWQQVLHDMFVGDDGRVLLEDLRNDAYSVLFFTNTDSYLQFMTLIEYRVSTDGTYTIATALDGGADDFSNTYAAALDEVRVNDELPFQVLDRAAVLDAITAAMVATPPT